MESSSISVRSNKRRRVLQFYVSSQWPDLPAIFESLNDDTLTTVLEFVGKKSYRSFGGVNKRCKEVYLATKGMTKETFLFGYGPLSRVTDRIERVEQHNHNSWKLLNAVGEGVVRYNRRDVMEWALEEKEKKIIQVICNVAACEERLDILDEVWNNFDFEDDEDVRRFVYRDVRVGYTAARHGKLNVLKWLETKGLSVNKKSCAMEAARHGHLHIMKWLLEEKDLELDEGLYFEAIAGGHLHVMKWLREKEVPWDEYTFRNAAYKANMNILQWLYDEGCTWPEYIQVFEDKVKPEVIEWLRSHGYHNRIRSLRSWAASL